ncbi:MAG: NAD(P)H-dependent oxidoreductase [Verrucomicrobiota bacterium]
MNTLIVSCSHHPHSKSFSLAQRAFRHLQEIQVTSTFSDLTKLSLPLCDGDSAYGNPTVQSVTLQVAAADAIFLAVPIYNYAVNAAAKNFIELTGSGWEGKVVGFLCAAGGDASYMSIMSLANSLMLDFRCLVVPRFVYATGKHFEGNHLTDPKIEERVIQLVNETVRITKALKMPSI